MWGRSTSPRRLCKAGAGAALLKPPVAGWAKALQIPGLLGDVTSHGSFCNKADRDVNAPRHLGRVVSRRGDVPGWPQPPLGVRLSRSAPLAPPESLMARETANAVTVV